MNKKLPLITGAVVLLIGIGAFLFLSGKNNNTSQSQRPPEAQTETSNQQKSLKDLLTLTKPQDCSFEDSTKNKGRVFVANNKMRGDFTSESSEKEIKSHIITDGQTSYLWIDGQNTGYKMSFDKISQDQKEASQQGQVDVNTPVDVNCKDWSLDPLVFNLPSEITFTDVSALTAPAAAGNTTTNSQCTACDSLPADAKAQCKQALNCN